MAVTRQECPKCSVDADSMQVHLNGGISRSPTSAKGRTKKTNTENKQNKLNQSLTQQLLHNDLHVPQELKGKEH